NGAGAAVIERAVSGTARPQDFLLKLLFTAVTLSCGFKGGEIVPTFYVGATFGCVIGPLLGLDPAFAAAVGMIAVFCGNTNCPIASVFLSIELFGTQALHLFVIACAISYMLSGNSSLYHAQILPEKDLKHVRMNIPKGEHGA
ncbi:MAG: chloride channel protein, partial [Clostridia bacterium]|nr:chloride channel protein [Clostridia bacterium]